MTTISLLKGDITTISVDAIVNAANSSLMGGGGVDGAIHRKGGKQILEECKTLINRQGSCKTGEAVYTSAGNLSAKYIIHTVGPIWNGGRKGESQLLASCYKRCLGIANQLGIKTIAFPNISTGAYRFPKEEAAKIAIETVRTSIKEDSFIAKVIFVCFDEENYELYKSFLK